MPIFTRSRSRDDRDRELTSKKWLSGISVGSWNLGLGSDDEEEELVNTSNALMIDRSEPAITWKAQVLLAKSKSREGERFATFEDENGYSDSLVLSSNKDSSGPEIYVEEVKGFPSSEPSVSECLLVRNSGEASEVLSSGSQSARFTAANTGAAEHSREDLMTDHQDQQLSASNSSINCKGPVKASGRCVAVGGSKGLLKTGIAAKASQGLEGGPSQSPIGRSPNTPTPLSYTRDKGEVGGEGDEKGADMERAMLFLNSHTTTGRDDPRNSRKGSPVQKKHGGGGDNATHAAVFSSSKCITDNGSSFSKGTGTWSLAVDCGSSASSSRTGLEVCMNDTTAAHLGEPVLVPTASATGQDCDSRTDKNTGAPSPSCSESDITSSSPRIISFSPSLANLQLADTEENSEGVGNNNNNSCADTVKGDKKTRVLAATSTPTSSWKTFPSTASHTNSKNNISTPVYSLFSEGSSGIGITRLHYSSSYQQPQLHQKSPRSKSKSGLSPGQAVDFDLTHNAEQSATTTSPPPQQHLQHQHQYRHQSSTNSPSSAIPSTSTSRNPPSRPTVSVTLSAPPYLVPYTSPTDRGVSPKVGSIPFLGTASPASSTPVSPIETCATVRESLQPQIQVPIPKEYHPQSLSLVGLESALEGANELVRTVSSSTSSLSSASLASFNTHLSSTTPKSITQSGNISISSASASTSPIVFTMAARSAAAQKSLKRSGASREQYVPFAPKHTSYTPTPLMDTASSSSNSSQEFQMQNDIQTLQAAARQREQAEAGYRGRADSGSRMQGNYVKGHGKSGSGGNEILENVFGIYPEKKSMGTGVSVADVVASKLFKWGSKKEAPSTIPTPSREKVTIQRSQRHPHHPSMFVGGVPQQVVRPASPRQDRDQDYHPSQRDDMLHSRASNLDQVKLDELMARQKLLEDRINQLKLERDQLMEANNPPPPQPQPLPLKPHHEAAQLPRHPSYVPTVQPLRIPSNPPTRVPDLRHSHSMSSAVHARQMAEPLDLPIQFPLPPQQPQPQYPQPVSLSSTSPGRGRSSRAFPPSKHIQPLKTTPMAIPIAARQDPVATSAHYISRPLPQPPIDATPPPEYEPPGQVYGRQYRDMKVKVASPTSGMVITQDVILEEPIPNPDDEKYPGSPRDDVDAEDILGWFETLKFASTGPRGRGPMAPLPRPEAADIKVVPRGGEKSPIPDSGTTSYFDVKVPIHTKTQQAPYDMSGMRKDWNSGRKKRSETRLRDYRDDNMSLTAL
ncbi:hypothetical protein TWF730_008971 [Orbilia blumenaviensis]|uniref:Uncharacterized protein n=1 Tax=Orbilia blumenaviensis TaxID=1796055 RepID=A0AAV9UXN1_9PEZI